MDTATATTITIITATDMATAAMLSRGRIRILRTDRNPMTRVLVQQEDIGRPPTRCSL